VIYVGFILLGCTCLGLGYWWGHFIGGMEATEEQAAREHNQRLRERFHSRVDETRHPGRSE